MASNWSTSAEDYQFIIYKMDSHPPKASISSPPHRPKRHVGFKDDAEEVREYVREESAVRPDHGGFQAHQENIDKEAAEFIKHGHKKFQCSRTMSAYAG